MRILIVLTSHGDLGNTGEKTGFWVEEFAAPYYVLADAGAEITIASPKGGQPPVDPRSEAPLRKTPLRAQLHRKDPQLMNGSFQPEREIRKALNPDPKLTPGFIVIIIKANEEHTHPFLV